MKFFHHYHGLFKVNCYSISDIAQSLTTIVRYIFECCKFGLSFDSQNKIRQLLKRSELIVYIEHLILMSQSRMFHLWRSREQEKSNWNGKLFDYIELWSGSISFGKMKFILKFIHFKLMSFCLHLSLIVCLTNDKRKKRKLLSVVVISYEFIVLHFSLNHISLKWSFVSWNHLNLVV